MQKNAHSNLDRAAQSRAMLEEFITTFAYPASQNHPRAMAAGLSLCFSTRSVFDASNGKIIKTCPIKIPFAHLLNMALEKDENGQWVEGKPAHGGLILSLMEIIKDLEQQPEPVVVYASEFTPTTP